MHVTAAQCVDTARGTLAAPDRLDVERHAQQCADCGDMLGFWRHVVEVAGREGVYEPPPWVVAAVKGYKLKRVPAVARSRNTGGLRAMAATLMFDTFQQALPAGVRTGSTATRQLVYVVSPLMVDLRLQTTPLSRRVVLAGQITTTHGVRDAGHGAHVIVAGPGEELTAAVIANQFGEFHCEFEGREDLTLSISLQDGAKLAIPLDRLPVV